MYSHASISSLLHSSMDLSPENETDKWHQTGLRPSLAFPRLSSMCATPPCLKIPGFGGGVQTQVLPSDVLSAVLRDSLEILYYAQLKRIAWLFLPSCPGHAWVHQEGGRSKSVVSRSQVWPKEATTIWAFRFQKKICLFSSRAFAIFSILLQNDWKRGGGNFFLPPYWDVSSSFSHPILD